jgi:hypothetical protein
MSRDTRQQKAILRQCKTARAVRKQFPVGTRVVARDAAEPRPVGVVTRHVPGTDAQGGVLVVDWESERFGTLTGRHGPISLEKVEP